MGGYVAAVTWPLVNCSVQIDPPPGDVGIGLIDEPAITWGVPAGSGGVDHQWGEPLYPALDVHVIDVDATLSQQFFDVSVGEPVAQVQ